MDRKLALWLRELVLRIRDRIEFHKRLPTTARKLSVLHKKKMEKQYCHGVLARILKAWHEASSIEMVIAATGKNWDAFSDACEHCPKDHTMRSEMLELLLARAWWYYQTNRALTLMGKKDTMRLPFEINDPDEPWRK